MQKRFLTIGVVGLGLFFAGVLMGQNASQPAKTEPTSAVARLTAAKRVCEMFHDPKAGASTSHTDHYLWSLRWMEAQRDVDAARGDRFSAVEAHLQRMRQFHEERAELFKSNVVSKFELASTEFYVAEAEEFVARERAK